MNLILLGKTAILTLVVSRFSKALGKKDIAEVIEGIGILACGVCLIVIFKPVGKDCQQFGNDIHDIGKGIHSFANWLLKFQK